MRWSAAAKWTILALAVALRQGNPAFAQTIPEPASVIAPVDWAAVRSQLAARTDNRMRQSRTPLTALIPPGFAGARSLNRAPKIPILVPLFAPAPGADGRSLETGARNYLPITQSRANGAGGRSGAPVDPSTDQPKTIVFPESNSYSATIKLPQSATVTILGSNVARPIAGSDGAARALSRGAGETIGRYQMSDVTLEQTETGWSINFTRFGVAYSVDISCAQPSDARCQDADFVRELAFSMGLVGAPPAPPPQP